MLFRSQYGAVVMVTSGAVVMVTSGVNPWGMCVLCFREADRTQAASNRDVPVLARSLSPCSFPAALPSKHSRLESSCKEVMSSLFSYWKVLEFVVFPG